MEYIKSYFLSIITSLIFIVIIEIIMPNTSFKKYIKVVLGLLVIMVMIKPITNFVDFEFLSEDFADEIVVIDNEYETVQNNQINDVFCENLRVYIKNDLLEKYDGEFIVNVDASCEELSCIYVSGISEMLKEDVEKYILHKYNAKKVVING